MSTAAKIRKIETSPRKTNAHGALANDDQPESTNALQQPQDDSSPAARAPAEAPAAETPPAASSTAPAKASRKRIALGALAAAVVLGGGWYLYDYVTVGRFIVSTDDAYVGVDMAIVSPKIAANVADVPVVENQHVKQGDVLVRLDDGDFKLAVDQAAARLATQKATIATFDAQIRAGEAGVAQSQAQLEAARANLAKTEADYARMKPLADRDFASKATLDSAIAARDTARAQVKANEASIDTSTANVALLKSQRAQAETALKELDVALAKAQRDLSFTTIVSPFDGYVGNKSVQVGDYVAPGKRLAAVVPLDKVYVDANLKETQLDGVAPGQTAHVSVDALGGKSLDGTVESIAPASGSQFSLLPPENATGNFTKIVQRVPVRIAVPAELAKGNLRPGLSVVVGIDTRTASTDKPDATPATKAASSEH